MTTDLDLIFSALRDQLKSYAPPFTTKQDAAGAYDLWSIKDLIIEGRKRKEVYFAGLIQYKTYVGFYYMPVYAEPEIKAIFPAELLALLKGKSCFHIKKLDDKLLSQIRFVLDFGLKAYQERGWV
ncbi:MAG TPA: hypothetical protein VN452_07165 [Longilinea sp.]|nr:hypothetical protein [Longilinea sp.]